MLHLSESSIIQLILAAGSSSRMGTPKQLLSWQSTTLIEYAVHRLQNVKEVNTYVVLGAYYDLIFPVIKKYPVTIVKNTDWRSGMGTSIRVGIDQIKKDNPSCKGVLISLVDQPLLDEIHFKNLIDLFKASENSIIATDLGKRIGVPAIFPWGDINEFSGLNEDYGARYFIEKNIDRVTTISAKNKGIDIDTPDQYQKLIRRNVSIGKK